MKQYINHIGESKTMNNGLCATIIEYRKYADIDVQFEDGAIVYHTNMKRWKDCNICHPTKKSKHGISLQEYAIQYYLYQLGFMKIEKRHGQDIGIEMYELDLYHPIKIAIEYDGEAHVTFNCKDRDDRKNKLCAQAGIKLYRIKAPGVYKLASSYKEFILHKSSKIQTGMYDCQKELEQILRENNIPFDDDFINFHRDKDVIFAKYNETHFDYYTKQRIGETAYSKAAKQKMTIIAYRSSTDIDVQFENGTIKQHAPYDRFLQGRVAPDNVFEQRYLGQSRRMNNGLIASIIAYRKSDDIDVEFEDGFVVEHITTQRFYLGTIKHPAVSTQAIDRTGEIRQMNNGMMAKVIGFRNSKDIDVEFENGIVVYNRDYFNFLAGRVGFHDDYAQRVGERKLMNCGKWATVTEYRNSHDIDVQFDDGSIRLHMNYAAFTKGLIKWKPSHVGETKIMKCGRLATIIAYRNSHDLDVQFEDGSIRTAVSYGNFNKGYIAVPTK